MTDDSAKTEAEAAVQPGDGYAGDARPRQAWEILEASPDAVLVDCRTQPEWAFVGVPDLSSLGRQAAFVPWQVFPSMQVNPEFVRQVKAAGAKEDTPVLTICRSGSRSRAAAIALTREGFTRVYNVAGGFEGALDESRHRGSKEGWKAEGLPWIQD